MSNPYSSDRQHATVEHSGGIVGVRRRVQIVAIFAIIDTFTGLLSGYFWFISPHGKHYPGPLFGIGLLAATLACSRFRHIWLAGGLLIASVAGFYFALYTFMETGFSPNVDRVATVLIGVAPIGIVFCLAVSKGRRLPFIGLVCLASLLGAYGFFYITGLRSRGDVLSQFDLLDPRRVLVFETLRFAVWQAIVAGVLGGFFPGRNVTQNNRVNRSGEPGGI
ncbi:MAG: hypothetical protein F9B45_16955 [Phycisphaera sp. RhM]|nr:hypothetical protein [Phycisphaera sp. RhM]